MFKIEKNIPIQTETQESASRFPFNDMEIGDSFIAETDPKLFGDIQKLMQERNEAGDGRLFVSWASMQIPFDSMLRIWRISPRQYLDRNPIEAGILWYIQSTINDGNTSTTVITQGKLGEAGTGSKAQRIHILKKYAFLFKKSIGLKGGTNYANV